jgi:hypothetical protein
MSGPVSGENIRLTLQLRVKLEDHQGPAFKLLLRRPGRPERREGVLGDPVQPPGVVLLIEVQERNQGGRTNIVGPKPCMSGTGFQTLVLVPIVVNEIRLRLSQNKWFWHEFVLWITR